MLKLRVLCGAAMLAACLAPAAHADEWSKLTYFTFNAPVEMPRHRLAGRHLQVRARRPRTTAAESCASPTKEGGKIAGRS